MMPLDHVCQHHAYQHHERRGRCRWRRTVFSAIATVVVAVGVAETAGCAGCDQPTSGGNRTDEGPPRMSKAELSQGRDICDIYVARVCACAERHEDFLQQCELARSQPEALRLHQALLNGSEGKLNNTEFRLTQSQARAVVKNCIK
ncbi:MAG: hypothetical protein V2A73_00970, partial [Pseudomonadota bacterium]